MPDIEKQIASDQNTYFGWKDTYKVRKEEYLMKFDQILSDSKEYSELIEMVSTKEFLSCFGKIDEFAYLIVASFIYRSEVHEQQPNTIFQRYQSVSALITHMIQVKFHIWRIETETESGSDTESDTGSDTAGREFVQYYCDAGMNTSALIGMIDASAMNPVACAVRMAAVFLEQKNGSAAEYVSEEYVSVAEKLITYAVKKDPGVDINQILGRDLENDSRNQTEYAQSPYIQDSAAEQLFREQSEKVKAEIQQQQTDVHKFCFIMCCNNEQYQKECMYYVNALHVPKGYEVEFLSITGADSMTSGYNEGMQASNAKYKIYLHQDVFIINRDFLYDILAVFRDQTVGMIGVIGCPVLHDSGIMWYESRIGKLYSNHILTTECVNFDQGECRPIEKDTRYRVVDAIDGMLMVTQYDVKWREDLFKQWDYYDISQCQEFRRAGYKVAVPQMETPWCIHDDGNVSLDQYYTARDIFLKEYGHELCSEPLQIHSK